MVGVTLVVGLSFVLANVAGGPPVRLCRSPRPLQLSCPGVLAGARPRRPARWVRRLLRNPLSAAGATIVAPPDLAARSSPGLFAPFPEDAGPSVHFDRASQPPGPVHWFGTDEVGRDIFSRTVFGARVSLALVVAVLGIALGVGVPLGLVAGYWNGQLAEHRDHARDRRLPGGAAPRPRPRGDCRLPPGPLERDARHLVHLVAVVHAARLRGGPLETGGALRRGRPRPGAARRRDPGPGDPAQRGVAHRGEGDARRIVRDPPRAPGSPSSGSAPRSPRPTGARWWRAGARFSPCTGGCPPCRGWRSSWRSWGSICSGTRSATPSTCGSGEPHAPRPEGSARKAVSGRSRSARGRGARGVYRGEAAGIGTTAALILKNARMAGAITWGVGERRRHRRCLSGP